MVPVTEISKPELRTTINIKQNLLKQQLLHLNYFFIPNLSFSINTLPVKSPVKTVVKVSISKHKKEQISVWHRSRSFPKLKSRTLRGLGFFSHSSFSSLSVRPQNIQWFSVTSMSPFSLSYNANKLHAYKLLTSLCIFISDGQKRVWVPIFKTKWIKRVCCFK